MGEVPRKVQDREQSQKILFEEGNNEDERKKKGKVKELRMIFEKQKTVKDNRKKDGRLEKEKLWKDVVKKSDRKENA